MYAAGTVRSVFFSGRLPELGFDIDSRQCASAAHAQWDHPERMKSVSGEMKESGALCERV